MAPERAITEGPIPKHAQLREILLKLIDDGLVPGAPIPSERELMTEHGVSRMTVREAIGQLVSEGKLYSVRGKGTFVAPPKVESQLHLASFTDEMRRRGLTPSTALLRAELADPPERVREALGIPPEGQAYHLERLRIADGTPMAFEDSWYRPDPLPDLLDKDLSGSLYTVFTDSYGLTIDSAEQTVWASVADAADARMLGVRAGAPLLAFQRVSSAGRIAVEYTTSWYRGDRYRVHMSLDSSFTSARPHH